MRFFRTLFAMTIGLAFIPFVVANPNLDTLRWQPGDTIGSSDWNSLIDYVQSLEARIAALEARNTGGAPSDVTAGLLARWTFDDPANLGLDSGPSAFHGTNGGGTPASDRHGVSNRAIAFDGNGSVSLPSAVVPGLPAGTVSVWVRLDATGRQHGIFEKSEIYVANYFQLIVHHDDRFRVYAGEAGNQVVLYNETTVVPARWYHVAVTWNGSEWTIYVDGTLETTVAHSVGVPSVDRTVFFGKVDGDDAKMQGRVDDIRVYDRALSASEIMVLAGQ